MGEDLLVLTVIRVVQPRVEVAGLLGVGVEVGPGGKLRVDDDDTRSLALSCRPRLLKPHRPMHRKARQVLAKADQPD